jgi:two-component system response regulator DctR
MNATALTSRPPEPMVHLVDDEAPVRDALSFLFQSHGLAVRCYASGPEFLDAADEAPLAGCILLDVRMEPMSGLQVHDALVARGSGVPVLFLSGHGDIPMAVEALKKGAFDFVEKPSGDAALVERVTRALAVDAARQDADSKGEETAARLASLSDREREVIRARVFGKLGVRSAAEVATLLARSR